MIPPPPRKHQCPHPQGGPLGKWYEPGTLWQCPECGEWWHAKDGEQVHGRTVWCAHSIWYPVSWWNFKMRRRIQAFSDG
jgi:hypothetical protein